MLSFKRNNSARFLDSVTDLEKGLLSTTFNSPNFEVTFIILAESESWRSGVRASTILLTP